MNFQISSSVLSSLLQVVGKVVNPKNGRDIMQCFSVSIKDKYLTLTGTDSELTLTSSAPIISQEGDFAFAINARTLTNAVKDLPEQPITLDWDEGANELTLYYQNGKYTLPSLSVENFPERGETNHNESSQITMTSEAFADGIARTLFATSTDEFKPALCGIFLDIFTDHITFVSTDSHRLIRYTLNNFQGEKESSFILPKKVANLLKSILPKKSTEIKIEFDAKRAQFSFNEYVLDCTLTEGKFPKYQAVIPKSSPYTLRVEKSSFLSALRRVSVCSNESNLVKFELLTNNQIELIAQDTFNSSSAQETLPAQYEGEPLTIGFKYTFLMEMVNSIECQEFQLSLSSPSQAGVLTPVDGSKEVDMLMLLMPMMVK